MGAMKVQILAAVSEDLTVRISDGHSSIAISDAETVNSGVVSILVGECQVPLSSTPIRLLIAAYVEIPYAMVIYCEYPPERLAGVVSPMDDFDYTDKYFGQAGKERSRVMQGVVKLRH